MFVSKGSNNNGRNTEKCSLWKCVCVTCLIRREVENVKCDSTKTKTKNVSVRVPPTLSLLRWIFFTEFYLCLSNTSTLHILCSLSLSLSLSVSLSVCLSVSLSLYLSLSLFYWFRYFFLFIFFFHSSLTFSLSLFLFFFYRSFFPSPPISLSVCILQGILTLLCLQNLFNYIVVPLFPFFLYYLSLYSIL